ncbi:MAG: type II toxin-antitoxin system RelE/ParE family toxin [Acidobacteria bacterium]|nr:type II toxin-antitoxin system RelE/ParE family toxin [Acidobacteriota bacterium]
MWPIRWTAAAASDLESIKNYWRRHRPEWAQPTVMKLYRAAQSLKELPYRGRPGREAGTRELVMVPLPYVIAYQVRSRDVCILRVLHTSRDRS